MQRQGESSFALTLQLYKLGFEVLTLDFDPMQATYPSYEDVLRAKIMDAAIVCMTEKGIDKTRIGDIATMLGISRQTIYNYFANKNRLFDAVLSREAISLVDKIARHIDQFDALDDKLTQAFLCAIEEFPQNPVLSHVITSGGQYLREVGHSRAQMQLFGELVLQSVFEQHPELKNDSAEICEFLSRNIISFLLMPDPEPRTPQELEGYVRRRLLPGLGIAG